MKKIILNSVMFLSTALLLSSCIKNDVKDPGGKTLIRLLGAGETPVAIPLDVNPPSETIEILDLRRDAANAAENNQPATITLTNTQAYLDAYNDDNGTSYELLPAGSYTFDAASGVAASGDTWTVSLAAGEAARAINITLDKTQLDLSKSYAFGVQITNTTVGEASLETGFAIVNVLIKNQFDGAYDLNITTTGWSAFAISDGSALDYPDGVGLVTAGENTLKLDNYYTGTNLQPGFSSDDVTATQFGAASPIFTIDLATYKVTNVDNIIPDDGRGRDFALNPAAGPSDNYYDPATKTLYTNYVMMQTGRPNLVIKAIFTYTGPR